MAIVNLKQGDDATDRVCEKIYKGLIEMGLEPIYDDRDERAGVKFAAMDLIGIPLRVTVGPRGLKTDSVEVRCRLTGIVEEVQSDSAVTYCKEKYTDPE